jgi:hypothetical protein
MAGSQSAAASEDVMQRAADKVLQHLNADPAEYQVIFTRYAMLGSVSTGQGALVLHKFIACVAMLAAVSNVFLMSLFGFAVALLVYRRQRCHQ